MTPFCSTIIATVGRSSLDRAVASVLQQALTDADHEVIVVNDSGAPLPPAAWQSNPRTRILHTNQRERSMARNSGAAAAHGRFLHFLDDDDSLAPNALQHFYALAAQSGAAWLYGGSQLVDRQGQPLIQLHHQLAGNCFLQVMAGEWVPLQASLIDSAAFFACGGFHPLLSGPEDIDLLRRIALRYDLAGTTAVVASITRGDAGSTTDYAHHPEQSRRAREQILAAPEVWPRLRHAVAQQTEDAAAWHGRIARIYLTSLVWNLQRRRTWTAASRAVYGLAAGLLAGPRLASGSFWRAMRHPYASETFARGFAAAQRVTE